VTSTTADAELAGPAEEIRSWRARIARRAASRDRWSARTVQLIDLARARHVAELADSLGEYTHWMGFTAEHPDAVDPALLSVFVAQYARLATNLGRGGDDNGTVLRALGEAIALQERLGAPVTDLYLAKVAYLRAEHAESAGRIAALRAAAASAEPGTEPWVAAMIARCWYDLDVSRYRHAIRVARRLREGLPGSQSICAGLAWEGVALFTSFQDLALAERRLREACRYEDRVAADPEIGQWVAMAYHYLARLAELRRDHRTSLHLYLRGQRVAAHSRESLHADTFENLRIAELLIAAGVYPAAEDHLARAYTLVRTFSDRSSARLQVELGYAMLEAATGDPRRAVRAIEQIRRRARAVGFWRGALLCQGYLLALAIRLHAYWRLPVLAARLVGDAVRGELRRNSLPRLVLRIPVMLPIALRRMSSRTDSRERITACPCDLHDPTQHR
jgi:hypothetical protein